MQPVDIEGHAAAEEQRLVAGAAAAGLEHVLADLLEGAAAERNGFGIGCAGQSVPGAARQQHGVAGLEADPFPGGGQQPAPRPGGEVEARRFLAGKLNPQGAFIWKRPYSTPSRRSPRSISLSGSAGARGGSLDDLSCIAVF